MRKTVRYLPIMSWRWLARCEQEPEWVQDLFFSEQDEDMHRAQCVCSGCDVKLECLLHAIEMKHPVGVWGMHSPSDRRKMMRQVSKVGQEEAVALSFIRIETRLYKHAVAANAAGRSLPTPQPQIEHGFEELRFDLASIGTMSTSVTRRAEGD